MTTPTVRRPRRRDLPSLVAAAAACAGPALAQGGPPRRTTIVVPYSPGNGLDLLARQYAEELQAQLGRPFVVENRAGAAGVVGTAYAARAPADGTTLLFTAHPPFAIAPLTFDVPPYDPLSGFVPVTRVGSVPLVLVTAAGSPFRDVPGMVAALRAHPDAGTYASAGRGAPGHLYGEALNEATGLALRHVPYRETGQALTDVLSGNVLVSFVSVTAAIQMLRDGGLRALAVGSRDRLDALPDVPTLAEATGRPGFGAGVWYGFFAPAGTSPAAAAALHAEIERASRAPRLAGFMERAMMIRDLRDPAAFARALAEDVEAARRLGARTELRER